MQGSAAIAAAPGRIAAPPSTLPQAQAGSFGIPALYLVSIAIVAGDAGGSLRIGPPLWMGLMLGAGAACAFAIAQRRTAMILALAALAAAAAAASNAVYAPAPDTATIRTFPDDRPIVFEGRIEREPERVRDVIRLYLRVQRAGFDAAHLAPATGGVRLTVPQPAPYRIGTRLRISARIRLPRNYGDPGEFDYESYMAREGAAATALVSRPEQIEVIGYRPVALWSTIEAIRGRIGDFIDEHLEEPQRAEMRALVIGERGGIGRSLRDTFALTGMAHLLVISGLHLGFVASVAFVVIRLACVPFARLMILGYANKLAAVAAGLAVTAYAAIAGTHVSTLRALIMVLCYVGAVLANRSREVLASLALAALIICVALPGSTADIGFQLSFAAVIGIVLGMRRCGAWWERMRAGTAGARGELAYAAAAAVAAYAAVSFFALIATAPLTAFYFNQFSLIGVVANSVVVPLMALGGMVLGLAAAALSFVWMPAAGAVVRLADGALALGNRMAELFVRLPGAWLRCFTPNLFELALVYALLGLWLCAPIRPLRSAAIKGPSAIQPWLRWRNAAAALLIGALALDAGWWMRARYFDPRLRVTFLSVGQGDAAVVQFPGSAVMLIDGGGAFKDGSGMGERVVAPFLWSRKIMRVDYLVMSHPEIDHFGGFVFIARNFHPARFWTAGAASSDLAFHDLLQQLAGAGARIEVITAASPMRVIDGVTVRCLGPQPAAGGSRNNNSMVLELSRGRWSFLFTGDLEAAGENLLLQDARTPHATVLKVPHHGSITSSTPRFVAAVHPDFAVISDGYHNRYHFPSPLVVRRYRSAGARVLRTDQWGAVGFEIAHDRMRLWTGRRERSEREE